MKNLIGIGLLVVVFVAGLQIGKVNQREVDSRKIHTLTFELARFQNRTVFHNAEKVARITGTPLYQVLTGKLDRSTEE